MPLSCREAASSWTTNKKKRLPRHICQNDFTRLRNMLNVDELCKPVRQFEFRLISSLSLLRTQTHAYDYLFLSGICKIYLKIDISVYYTNMYYISNILREIILFMI